MIVEPSPQTPHPEPAVHSPGGRAHKAGAAALVLGALGVVFGDIGTSPLYSMQTVFTADGGRCGTAQDAVYGVVSLVFWAIMLIVSVKYVSFILRADNDGEGGIMALTALIQKLDFQSARTKVRWSRSAIIGASLFYGDGMITPAISVLSAVEGLKVAAPSLAHYVVPRRRWPSLIGLFAIQRFGTAVVGKLFGPVMTVWFLVIARGRGRGDRRATPAYSRPCPRPTGRSSSSTTASSRSSRSPRSCWRSPAPRPCTPTWATSAAHRSAGPGSSSCSPR